MSIEWNRDIDEAPKGHSVLETRANRKGEEYSFERFVRDEIYIAVTNKDGSKVVTLSYWMPNQNRWCMCVEGQEIDAWMPKLIHPDLAEVV